MLPWLPGTQPLIAIGPAPMALTELAQGDPSALRALRLGLWAGKRLGLGGAALALYGAGALLAGEARARRRIAAVLAEAGQPASEAELDQASEAEGG
jgi:hypothetical protein